MGFIAIDLGGTKTLAARVAFDGKIEKTVKFSTPSFNGIEDLLRAIFDQVGFKGYIYLAAAGPILNGILKVTQFGWVIESIRLEKEFGIKKCFLFNDLVAMGWSIPHLALEDFIPLYNGVAEPFSMKLLIAPGTGLGVCFGLEKSWYPSEAGHMDFAPVDAHQYEIMLFFKKKYHHVSFERLLGGNGFCDLLAFYTGEHEMGAQTITQKAKDRSCPFCIKVVEDYISITSAFIANAALFTKPEGGIYLGGGILPHFDNSFQKKIRSAFASYGRVSYLLEKIPLFLITNENSVILGLCHLAVSGKFY